MRWKITKEFNFEYGHRVWNQSLNKEFSIDDQCVCKGLHGHSGKVLITLTSQVLKDGMVTDFKHLQFFKQWLDTNLDHKFIIDSSDPALDHHFPEAKSFVSVEEGGKGSSFYKVNPHTIARLPSHLQSTYSSLVIVKFVPTSENLTHWIYEIVKEKISKLGITVDSVTLFETVKSQSVYEA